MSDQLNYNTVTVRHTASIGITGHILVGRSYTYPGYLNFSYQLPQSIAINDTSQQRLSGYGINISMAGQKILNREHFYLFITEGVGFGRIKLKNQQNQALKNPYFSPFAGVVASIRFRSFSFVFISHFDLDLSSSKWKEMCFATSPLPALPDVNQSGLRLKLGISWCF